MTFLRKYLFFQIFRNESTRKGRATLGVFWRASLDFLRKAVSAASFGEDAGYLAMLFFPPASRVLPKRAVSVALAAV